MSCAVAFTVIVFVVELVLIIDAIGPVVSLVLLTYNCNLDPNIGPESVAVTVVLVAGVPVLVLSYPPPRYTLALVPSASCVHSFAFDPKSYILFIISAESCAVLLNTFFCEPTCVVTFFASEPVNR